MTLVSKWFAPDGLIARRMPGFEPRPQQLQMAAAVADVFKQGGHLAAEAGTGVGKTFAYLVPALDQILPPPCPDTEADALLPAYLWMRDRLPRRPKCLFDSLALLDFLHGQNAAATIVFGVKARPFTAHCWIEHSGIVLNDRVDHVGTFTPILAR